MKKNYIIIDSNTNEDKEYVEVKLNFDKANMRNPDVFNSGICSDIKSLDDLLRLDKKHGLTTICKKVIKSFEQFYDVSLNGVDVVSKYTSYEVNAIYKSGNKKEIIIDPLLFGSIHAYFVVSFIWEDYLYYSENQIISTISNSDNINDRYFRYLTTVFYSIIKDETLCNIYKFKYVKEYYDKIGENALFNVIVNCQYYATYFCVAHECAHAYFDIKGIEFCANENYSAEEYEEFEADKLAYNLILKMIKDENKSSMNDEDREVGDNSHLAPMMLMEFYYLYMIINKKLSAKKDVDHLIKNVQNRGNKLLDYYHQSIKPYGKTDEFKAGEIAYQANQNIMGKYCEMFNEYNLNGNLDNILNILDNC